MTRLTTPDPPVDPPPTTPPDLSGLLLNDAYVDVSRVLAELGGPPEEAGQFLARELGLKVRRDEGQAIASMVVNPACRGVLRNRLCKALSLWVMVRRTQAELFESEELDPGPIESATALLPPLMEALKGHESEFRADEADSRAEQYVFEQIRNHLTPSRESLTAALLVGPRLADVARALPVGKLLTVLPSAPNQDLRVLASTSESEQPWVRDCSRWCLTGLILLEIIGQDLFDWETLERSDVAGTERIAAGRALADDLGRDKLAYGFIFERLQRQQEAALVGGQKELAESLRRIQGRLFSSQLKLTGAHRSAVAQDESANADVPRTSPAELRRLLAECAKQQPAPQPAPDEQEEEKRVLYRAAARDLGSPPSAPVVEPGAVEQPQDRRRLQILLGIVALLGVGCVFAYARLLTRPEAPDVRVPLEELSSELQLDDAMVIGPLMYARIDGQAWQALSEPERFERVTELGRTAVERGCEELHLTDQRQTHLATWTREEGTKLAPGSGG